MNYPTPMDIAESEDREADLSPSERLANICAALEEDLNQSPFTREEWDRLDAERLELLKANDALAARLAEAETQNRVMWDVASDREARLAEAQEELAQWRATGESVTRNEHDLSARLAEVQDKLSVALSSMHDLRDARDSLTDRLAEAREILKYLRAILPGDVWADDARRMIDAVLAADQSAG